VSPSTGASSTPSGSVRLDPAEKARLLHDLGRAIRLRRIELELSQDRMATRSRQHRNYIGALERGEINPTYETLVRIARGLDLPLDRLISQASGSTNLDGDRAGAGRRTQRGRRTRRRRP